MKNPAKMPAERQGPWAACYELWSLCLSVSVCVSLFVFPSVFLVAVSLAVGTSPVGCLVRLLTETTSVMCLVRPSDAHPHPLMYSTL